MEFNKKNSGKMNLPSDAPLNLQLSQLTGLSGSFSRSARSVMSTATGNLSLARSTFGAEYEPLPPVDRVGFDLPEHVTRVSIIDPSQRLPSSTIDRTDRKSVISGADPRKSLTIRSRRSGRSGRTGRFDAARQTFVYEDDSDGNVNFLEARLTNVNRMTGNALENQDSYLTIFNSALQRLNGTKQIFSRLVVLVSLKGASAADVVEFNKMTQSDLRNKAANIQRVFEPLSGFCFVFSQVVLYAFESTPEVARAFYEALRKLEKMSLMQLKRKMQARSKANLTSQISAEGEVIDAVRLLHVCSNTQGRCFPGWAARQLTVPQSAPKDMDPETAINQVVLGVVRFGGFLTQETARAASKDISPVEKRKILNDMTDIPAIGQYLPSYDVLLGIISAPGSEKRHARMQSLLTTLRSGDDVEDVAFPASWERKRIEGIPCCFKTMEGFPEVITTVQSNG